MGLWDSLFSSKNVTPAPTQKAPRMGLLRSWNICEIAPSDYVVLDLETAGLDACTCDILEIGLIRYRNHIEVDRYHSMVQPEGRIEPQAAAVNGITWAKVCRAPLFSELKDRVFSFIGEDTVVGFNVDFDVKFLQTRAGQKLDNSMFDVLALARGVMPNRASYKLDALRGELGLGGKAHTAIGDCIATQCLYKTCLALDGYAPYIAKRREAEEKTKAENDARKQKTEEEALIRKQKKDKFREGIPSEAELQIISQNMTDEEFDCLFQIDCVMRDIGVEFKKPNEIINRFRHKAYAKIHLGKKLRYIAVNVPPESVSCRFVVAPTTDREFLDGSQIFISSARDVREIAEYIHAAYNRTKRR